MPAGLQIVNAYGTVQIDENWKNYGFKQIIDVGISVVLPAGTPNVIYDLVVPGQMAMVAFRASTFRGTILNSRFDGSNYIFKFLFEPPPAIGTVSETIRFYVFDVPQTGGLSNVGLEVFNAGGERVYHSDIDVMKIAAVLPCNVGFSGDPSRAYAPLIAIPPFYKPGGTGNLWFWALLTSGHVITPLEQISRYVAPFSGAGGTGLYAVIDVTGLS